MWKSAKISAKRRNLEFTIEPEDIIIPKLCPILGLKLQIDGDTNGRMDITPSIDRIDNNKGYVKGNIQIISWRANMIKTNATLEELEKFANFFQGRKSDTLYLELLNAIKIKRKGKSQMLTRQYSPKFYQKIDLLLETYSIEEILDLLDIPLDEVLCSLFEAGMIDPIKLADLLSVNLELDTDEDE